VEELRDDFLFVGEHWFLMIRSGGGIHIMKWNAKTTFLQTDIMRKVL